MTMTLFGFLPLYWPPQAAHHQLRSFFLCPEEIHQIGFKRESATMRANVRQSDPSLIFDWRDDPPREVRAFPQNILYNALSVLIFLLHLIVVLSHLRTCPYAELAFSRDLFQKDLPQSPDFSALYAWRISTPSTRKSLLCRRSSCSTLYGVSCCHLPSVPDRHTFPASSKINLAHAFFDGEKRSNIFRQSCSKPNAAHSFLSA